MPQTKLIIDANIYFSVGRDLDPFLGYTFCDEEYALYLCDNFYDEFSRNPGLVKKFGWVDDLPFRVNRRAPILSRTQKSQIKEKEAYLEAWQEQQRNFFVNLGLDPNKELSLDPKEADRHILATVLVTGFSLVTDDKGLAALAKATGATALSLVEMLRLMFDCAFLDIKQLDGLAQSIDYFDRSDGGAWFRKYLKAFPESALHRPS